MFLRPRSQHLLPLFLRKLLLLTQGRLLSPLMMVSRIRQVRLRLLREVLPGLVPRDRALRWRARVTTMSSRMLVMLEGRFLVVPAQLQTI
ncbi:MAG: hypothetical protein JOS17DRAFT_741391 [Linnemannia elongata]|nr:MAG: hypothetical protein JOS17DRAFT_741391 [Linnemannia elongata]